MSITTEQIGDVTVIDLGDGDNRFNRESVDGINAALDAIDAHDGPAALVTTGTGKIYSNGLDLDWLGEPDVDMVAFVEEVHELLFRVRDLDVITVAAINGHAFAGGAMLATAHDFAVMRSDRGYWCLPEVDLGLPLTPQMYEVVCARISRPTLNEAILTGRRYTGEEALGAGLVSSTAAEADVRSTALEIATANASKNRNVIAAHKALLYGSR